jgi:hypothetical protein
MLRLLLFFLSLMTMSGLTAQRVAINEDGTAPATSAALDVKSTTKGFLWPRQTSIQRVLINNPANGLLVYDNQVGLLHNYATGNGWRSFINNNYWLGFTGTVYNATANVGLGTTTPTEKLHLVNGNFKITGGNLSVERMSGLTQQFSFDYTGASPNGFAQGIDYRTNSSSRNAYINYIASTTAGEDELRFYPSVTGLHLFNMFSNGEFRFSANDGPTFQFQDGGVNKGFFQIAGNDLRIGTNSGNSLGRVVIRNNGNDHVFITSSGRMGIGVLNPTEALHVDGNIANQNSLDINALTTVTNLEFGGRLTKPSVSNSALTPLCYGSVNADGTARSVTPNASVSKSSTGFYTINCTGLDSTCMVLVTAGEERHLAKGYPGLNTMTVTIFQDRSTAPPAARDADFCFVVYKK